MGNQESLTDYFGNPPELNFYSYKRAPKSAPVLVFKDKDGFWKAKHYIHGVILNMKLTKLYFEYCTKVSDDKVQEIIANYKENLKNLKSSLETKRVLSKLEGRAETA